MKKLLLFVAAMAISVLAKADISKPDFAYPRQVINDAEQSIKSTQRSGDGIGTLQALMQINVASSSIDKDSMQYVARRVLQIAAKEKKPQVRSLMNLYGAYIIRNIYNNRRYVYNKRSLPLTPRPADMSEWSGDMFNAVIDSLCNLAWKEIGDMSITDLSQVIDADDVSARFYPTQADFVASQILTTFNHDEALTAKVRAEIEQRHSNYSAAWCNWQAQHLFNDKDMSGLMQFYANTPTEYKLNAAVAFQYLNELNIENDDIDNYGTERYLSELQTALAEQKNAWGEKPVQDLLNNVLQPLATISLPQIVVANVNFDIKIKNIRNVATLTIDVLSGKKSVEKREIAINHLSPVPGDTTVQMSLPVGAYTLKAYISADEPQEYKIQAITAYPFVLSYNGSKAVQVVDAQSGESLANVTVSAVYNNSVTAKAVTDKNGIAHFGSSVRGYVRITHNGIAQDFSTTYLQRSNTATLTTTDKGSCYITTDMPVYRPGDTVQWAGLLSTADGTLADKQLGIKVMNRKNEAIATFSATTDNFGRVNGSLTVPDDAQLGSYYFSIDGANNSSAGSFTVSEFKPAAIRITDYVATPLKAGANSVTVSGKVLNYSDFGIDNATVECLLDTISVQGLTDTNGAFEVTVPYPNDDKTTRVVTTRVVAQDGSEASLSILFYCNYPYKISVADKKYYYDVANGNVTFSAKVLASDDSVVDAPIHWTLTNKNEETKATGTLTKSGDQALDLSNITAGRYTLEFKTDSTYKALATQLGFTLYNSKRKELPIDGCLWTNTNDTAKVCNNGKTAMLTVGVRDDNTYVYVLADGDLISSVRKLNAGYHTITVDISKVPAENRYIKIYAVRNADSEAYTIALPRVVESKLKFITESFRDKIYALNTEHWRFSVTDDSGAKLQSAMILSVYDQRLDNLGARKSSLGIPSKHNAYNKLSINYPLLRTRNLYVNTSVELSFEPFTAPNWQYSSNYASYGFGTLTTRRYATQLSANMVMANASAKAESAVSEDADTADAEVETVSGSSDSDSDISEVQLRSTDNYLALWQPMLESDANGNYDIDFVVPNANTTWHLAGFAWTQNGKGVSFKHDFVASKPLMVSINAPQFVRNGDNAVIAVTVMNNSDITQTVKIAAQIDADTLATTPLASETRNLTLDAGSSDVIYITLNAAQKAFIDADNAYITARVSNGTFGDGERVSIPVLESQTSVVNSTNFYLNPGDKTFGIDLPEQIGDDYSCTLKFTGNPMWTVVESLPILTSEDKIWNTATCQAAAYFASTVALMLQKEHAELELQFNISDMKRVQKTALQNLLDLQLSDGSWRWGKWSSVGSSYSTATVLAYMATLKQAGYLPSDSKLRSMIESALKFYDKSVENTDLQYTITRAAFSDVEQSLNGKKVTDATVQWINKNWKSFSVATKATAATALQYTGNKNMAKTLISSLDEFGTQTATKGFEFMNERSLTTYARLLHAYSAIVPQSAHVDGLRQYLIVRKQATDWGNYAITSDIVATMITSGTKWTTAAAAATISVDGTPLNVSGEGRMGVLTTDVTGRHLDITVNGDTPAYGAVIAKYNAEMKDIDAYSDGEISIDKAIYVQRDGKWTAADTLSVGDHAKITLTVKTSRPFSELTITDDRAATFQPKVQLPGWAYGEGFSAYRENRTSATNLYINYIAKGTYLLEYEMTVNNAGTFASGIATVTCAQAPELTAHSGGTIISVIAK